MRAVRLAMLKDPKRRHPYYWASFVVSGDWASLDDKRLASGDGKRRGRAAVQSAYGFFPSAVQAPDSMKVAQ